MKDPKFGKNAIQSYAEFDTPEGTVRLGEENKRLFIEINEVKTYLTDADGNITTNVIGDITAAIVDASTRVTTDSIIEHTASAGVTIEGIQFLDDAISPTASVVEKTVLTTLTADQIVGTDAGDVGHASGAILVASPGSGYVLELISAILIYDYDTAAYTGGGDDTVIQLGTVAQTAAVAGADLLEASGDKIVMLTPLAAVDLPMTVGTALNLQGTALTDPGTAVGVLRCYVTYRIITTGL